MLEPWELILHHTYSGTPGVIFDHSPGRGSPGAGVGLDPSDFLLDGSAAGSGAVRFFRRKAISVTPTRGWDHLGAFRAEVVFKAEVDKAAGRLFTGEKNFFGALFNGDVIDFSFRTTSGFQRFEVRFADAGVDPREWTTATVVHDGLSTVQLALNGSVVRVWTDRPLQPVKTVPTVTIGNEAGSLLGFEGLIDDVKIWRLNPHRINGDFTDRIVKAGVTDCWVQWGREFRRVLDDLAARDPECLGRITRLLDDIPTTALAPGLAGSAAARQAFAQALADYGRLWSRGHLAEIGPVLIGLRDTLRANGIDVENSAAFRTLVNDRCFQDLVGHTPSLDCDPAFTRMLRGGEA